VDVVQVPFGLLDPQATGEVFPLAARHGQEVWVRGVLAGGVLSASVRGDSAALQHPKSQLISALIQLADRAGVSLFQLAVDYARSREEVSIVLIGMHSSQQLGDSLRLMASRLTDRSVLDEAHDITVRWAAEQHESS
jgi:aryl-alcohol dehydrogenase-like predicted oxidoreductase